MKRLMMLLGMFLLFSGFTLQWDAPTTYVDGTPLTGKTILYDAWVDGAKFYDKGAATSVVLPAPGSGVAHLYVLTANVDNVSSDKVGFNWTSPLFQPVGPANLRVVP